jgi:hypothetical protein
MSDVVIYLLGFSTFHTYSAPSFSMCLDTVHIVLDENLHLTPSAARFICLYDAAKALPRQPNSGGMQAFSEESRKHTYTEAARSLPIYTNSWRPLFG